SQLKVLIPERIFDVSAGKVTLKPFKFKQFNQALEKIEPYLKTLSSVLTTEEILDQFLAKSEDHYLVLKDLVELLAVVSGETAMFFDNCSYDEVISLVSEVIDMNLDFFSRLGTNLKEQEAEPKTGESKSAA
ncbi:MAG: hypothetical protein RLZZ148_2155, partial [Cyanobacteriota bacterium]